ncbi:MAG: 5-amino-6-(D-ribitylamino)uracil--L-tyrosine 4-hydroxyphenyl transferase CofH [Deltaproteobacteria bacterium]|nr:5-amino-6-(D-ribitylamino)uracil--L-tyrosine 4-hydroxyphenyl transferase CofH [Deltaproteobacteria bacterium]
MNGPTKATRITHPDVHDAAFLSRIDPEVARILDHSLAGGEIAEADATTLFDTEGAEMSALLAVADHHRRDANGDLVTFVFNRNINFTNRCFVGCQFCNFKVRDASPKAYYQDIEAVALRADEAVERGATEVCIQAGLNKDLPGNHYEAVLRAIRSRHPSLHIHAYSPMEIHYGAKRTGRNVRDHLLALKDAGLDTIPGTAAEILVDEVRKRMSPYKLTVDEWVNVVTAAHEAGIPSTSTIMFGHIEERWHWSRHLSVIRDLQKRTGGITEFVPLAFVHTLTPLYLAGGCRPGPTAEEKIKMYAVSRLFLRGWIDNIQVSWPKLGHALAQTCLDAGANDFGGTLMEESISRMAGAVHGQYVSPDAFREMIYGMGRLPAQRSTLYRLLRIFPKAGQPPIVPDELRIPSTAGAPAIDEMAFSEAAA